jgi:hypothetical protein
LHILLVGKEGQPYFISYISSFSLFHFFCEFYSGEEGKESMMDHHERIGRILVVLALYWCLHMIVQHVLDMQALALNGEWGFPSQHSQLHFVKNFLLFRFSFRFRNRCPTSLLFAKIITFRGSLFCLSSWSYFYYLPHFAAFMVQLL